MLGDSWINLVVYVALRTEGVDRNLKTITGSRFCQVALRTEGVDRNSLADAKILSDAVALRTEGVDRNRPSAE